MFIKPTDIQPNDYIVSKLAGTRQVNTVEILETLVRVQFVDGGYNQYYKMNEATIQIMNRYVQEVK